MLKYKFFDDNGVFVKFTNKREKNHTTTKPLKPLFSGEKVYFKNNNWNYSFDEKRLKDIEFKEITDFIYDFCDIRCIINNINNPTIQPHKRNGKVSVCIPCFGKQAIFIIKAVESVLHQTYKPSEIVLLLMDNESISLKETLEKKSNIIKCYISKREYIGIARRKLAKLAKEDWICFLDADDTLPSNFLEDVINQKEDADIYIASANLVKSFKEVDFFLKKENKNKYVDSIYSNGNLTGLINKEVFLKYSYDKRFIYSYEDVFFIFNACKNGIKTKYLSNIFFNYFKNKETETSFINITDDLRNNHDSTKFKKLLVDYLKKNKNIIKLFENTYTFNLFKKIKCCGYRTINNDFNFFYFYILRRNRVLFQKLLKARSKQPISNNFNVSDYNFINIKDVYVNILCKKIQNYSFDVLILDNLNFYNFYDKEIKYIVRKELSDKSLEELVDNYSCACLNFDFTLSDIEGKINLSILRNKLKEIKKVTKNKKLIKEINFMLDPVFLYKKVDYNNEENKYKYYSIAFIIDDKISIKENFKKIKNTIEYFEKTKKTNKIFRVIIPKPVIPNLFVLEMNKKNIEILDEDNNTNCQFHNDIKDIYYYVAYNKIARCKYSKFLEKPEYWTKKLNFCRICRGCKKINYLE